MIRRLLEKNPQTLVEAKRPAKDIENIEKDYEKLWKKEDNSIPQFIPIRPRVQEGESGMLLVQVPVQETDAYPRPLAVREPTFLLALPAPNFEPTVEEIEQRL